MTTASDSVRNFLTAKRSKGEHANPDLLARFLTHCGDMEVQVNVHAAGGEPVAGKRNTYTDGIQEWFSYRIPQGADGNPHFKDYPLRWPLDKYAEAIGSTGWDWRNRRSRWCAFDFDSIVGHARGVGICDSELAQVRDAASSLPYVQTQRSTRGSGLHLYVFFDDEGVLTANHHEHAALARAVLAKMSTDTSFDFNSKVDVCGANMWIWHRKAAKDGYGILKVANQTLCAPCGWQAHLDVVRRRTAKVVIPGATGVDVFDELVKSCPRFPLDDNHKQHIEGIAKHGIVAVWVQDHHLLQSHTVGFQRLHEVGGVSGIYQTVSAGTDLATANCFAFPLPSGGWTIYRFGPGTAEAPTWEQDGKGWTRCRFNVPANLRTLARLNGGVELPRGGWQLRGNNAVTLVKQLGADITFPNHLLHRLCEARENRDGRLVIEAATEKGDPSVEGWGQGKGKISRVFDVQTSPHIKETDCRGVRIVISPKNEFIGCFVESDVGTWDSHPVSNAKMVLQALGHSKPEAEQLIGDATRKRWTAVTIPFAPEYLGNRQWNMHAPQLRYQPADTDYPIHPTWDAVLGHLGKGLDDAVKKNEWCRDNNVTTGAEWWRLWYAITFRDTYARVPYVFAWGPPDSGKSSIFEVYRLLVTGGVSDMKRALTNREGFNGEIEGCILGFIDEYDLSKETAAALRIKEWTTALEVSIRRMRTNQYQVPNCMRFVHVANDPSFVEVLPDDVRITVCYVGKPEVPIDKDELHRRLTDEAPHFMRTLMDLHLPPPCGRLRLPVLEDEGKRELAHENEPLAEFIEAHYELVPGSRVLKVELHEQYRQWCVETGIESLKPETIGKRLRKLSGGRITTGKAPKTLNGKRPNQYIGLRHKTELQPITET